MLLISLILHGSNSDLEGLYPIAVGANLWVQNRANGRLLVRAMEYTGRICRQLHNLIRSLIDSTTHYNKTLDYKTLLKPRISLPLIVQPPSSVKNVTSAFQSDIY
jgi:hypothetical protein